MHLQRVVVPDFRVLKDVDITFEKDFTPSVFPLGSQNGGGKSTLLQLIFTLLHCSADEKKHEYIRNLLAGYTIEDGHDERELASFEIVDGAAKVKLHFKLLGYNEYHDIITWDSSGYKISEIVIDTDYISKNGLKVAWMNDNGQSIVDKQNQLIKDIKMYGPLFLIGLDHTYEPQALLVCHIYKTGDGISPQDFMEKLSNQIYLAAPSTQTYLFLPLQVRRSLLSKINDSNRGFYTEQLQLAKSNMPNFFTYDFLSFDLLIDSFKEARDNDFREAVKTGTYGQSYLTLLSSLNNLLADKQITLNEALDDVVIRLNDGTEINVEDLSHGELKRLTLFLWLKYHTQKNAIILMDEIENALHPDWQYGVVRDLEEWAPSTQFILATHSYELCEGVTPAHVKELSPRLLKKEDANGDD